MVKAASCASFGRRRPGCMCITILSEGWVDGGQPVLRFPQPQIPPLPAPQSGGVPPVAPAAAAQQRQNNPFIRLYRRGTCAVTHQGRPPIVYSPEDVLDAVAVVVRDLNTRCPANLFSAYFGAVADTLEKAYEEHRRSTVIVDDESEADSELYRAVYSSEARSSLRSAHGQNSFVSNQHASVVSQAESESVVR